MSRARWQVTVHLANGGTLRRSFASHEAAIDFADEMFQQPKVVGVDAWEVRS